MSSRCRRIAAGCVASMMKSPLSWPARDDPESPAQTRIEFALIEHGPTTLEGRANAKGRPPTEARLPSTGLSSRTDPGAAAPPTGDQLIPERVHVPPMRVALLITNRRPPVQTPPAAGNVVPGQG